MLKAPTRRKKLTDSEKLIFYNLKVKKIDEPPLNINLDIEIKYKYLIKTYTQLVLQQSYDIRKAPTLLNIIEIGYLLDSIVT